MIKNLIGGIAIGIANVIPGVSGGTMMVILGIFETMMESVAKVFKKNNPDRMKHILFLVQVMIGALIGLVGFAKILNVLFEHFPTMTMYWFIGLVVFSIPLFLQSELKNESIHIKGVILGMAIIFLLQWLSPVEDTTAVNPEFPPLTITHLLIMLGAGVAGGFSMLLPGVSGSMVLLIIGQYYLFKSYLAAITTFSLQVLIPLAVMGIGILIGIILSAKVTSFALKKNKRATLSFILGLIIASSIVLIPLHATYSISTIIGCILSTLFGGVIVLGLKKLA